MAGGGRLALCFDIDGTLLTTERAGVAALEDAAESVCGARPDLGTLRTAGLTDGEIAEVVLRQCRGHADRATVGAFLAHYERRLPACLPLRQGRVLAGVLDALQSLRAEGHLLLLLTGNTEAGAGAKLEHYGLSGHFHGGAFCRGADDRVAIGRRARELVAQMLGEKNPPAERFWVIGDTPADIRCGHAVGARTVAVASGTYTLEELRRERPWKALRSLAELRSLVLLRQEQHLGM